MTLRLLLASAELSPLVKVGGLADAVAGLRSALISDGVDVVTTLPHYRDWQLAAAERLTLDVPEWAAPATATTGRLPDGTPLTLISVPGIDRPHPYIDDDGEGWPDNDRRFLAYSAAVAAFARLVEPDVVHLNDWHTGAVLGFGVEAPSVFTIHNLAYQGRTEGTWLEVIPHRPEAYEWFGDCNPLSGAVALADRVVTVSPRYATEILTPDFGEGLHDALAARGVVGITNGLDTTVWDPATDTALPAAFDAEDTTGRRASRREVTRRAAWAGATPVAAMVTRLTDQKGVDLALDTVPYLPGIGVRLVLLGSGDRRLAERARALAEAEPDWFSFWEGYDEAVSHQLFAGSDLLLMPSRFEPCGLNQLQAMRYGSIPVATPVGGLVDTIADADADPDSGTGFLAADVSLAGVVDALHRAARALRSPKRRRVIQHRGMTTDWSWAVPAGHYRRLYEELGR